MLDRLHNLLTGAGFEPAEVVIGRDNKYQLGGKDAAWTNFTNDAAGGVFEVSFSPEGLAHFLDRVERLEKALEQATEEMIAMSDDGSHIYGVDTMWVATAEAPELAQYLAEREAGKCQ